MFFNYFLFGLIVFAALSKTTFVLFGKLMGTIGLPTEYLIDLSQIPEWIQFILYFILYDLVQWSVHVILHRSKFLWQFHKVHHSVTEMGFAAHLRFHFMESVIYQIFKFTLLAYIFNFDIHQAFYIYFFATTIGHLNHANVGWDYGPLKYILNNPKMHIWHHAKDMPESHPHGINFGITLSLWDYLFGTNYIPESGRDIELGFDEIEKYPTGFFQHMIEPFKRNKHSKHSLDN
jgi:sterol desaturase/sphingolipid hydroxylase (fatty acid hydroxylase superfamily)